MGYNLPEGNNSFLNDDDMICQHCDHKDDVSNGEYHNHRWYCDDCFKELFKVCPKCNVCVISVDEEMCEDCLAEKTYDESAEGMFEKLGYKLSEKEVNYIDFVNSEGLYITFWLHDKTYNIENNDFNDISVDLHQAVTQQMKELGWL